MIDDSILKYGVDVHEILGPLGITSEVSERDSCYYLTVDGSKLRSDAAGWKAATGRDFVTFVTVFIPRMFTALESVTLNETRVEFRIGTIFDIMMKIEEYGEQN